MNIKYRKVIIAGNWKMNKTPSEVKPFIDELRTKISKTRNSSLVICAPFPLIPALVRATKESRISVGAQNVSEHPSGAYTGEVSVSMLCDAGVKFVIVGHSERRGYFCETDEMVNLKTRAVLDAGLTPIICVGESEAQRDANLTPEIVSYQVKSALFGLDPSSVKRCVIAYEPIWAIGTGRTASAQEAGQAAETIRTVIRNLYGARTARTVSVLYGGSMNPKNAEELLAIPDIDGGLIGGASLSATDFADIAAIANSFIEQE